MARIIGLCGRICGGKTVYAERLCRETGAVSFSVDEIMLGLFGQQAGERHNEWVGFIQKYLLDKGLQIARAGVDVVMDWGLWKRENRAWFRNRCRSEGVDCEIHYLDVDEAERFRRLGERNRAVLERGASAYVMDDGLAAKLDAYFEAPEPSEIDWIIGPDGSARAPAGAAERVSDPGILWHWPEAFGKGVPEDRLKALALARSGHLWHIFSEGMVPCLEEDAAERAYAERDDEWVLMFRGDRVRADGAPACSQAARIHKPKSAELIRREGQEDIFITAEDFSWTYVRAHEDGRVYFCPPVSPVNDSDPGGSSHDPA